MTYVRFRPLFMSFAYHLYAYIYKKLLFIYIVNVLFLYFSSSLQETAGYFFFVFNMIVFLIQDKFSFCLVYVQCLYIYIYYYILIIQKMWKIIKQFVRLASEKKITHNVTFYINFSKNDRPIFIYYFVVYQVYCCASSQHLYIGTIFIYQINSKLDHRLL